MHEYSIVSDLINLVYQEANKYNATNVLKLVVAIGERSGVDSNLLLSCFETFKEECDLIKSSVLEVVIKKVKLQCNCCMKQFYADSLSYGICIYCNCSDVDIIEGKELYLLSIEME